MNRIGRLATLASLLVSLGAFACSASSKEETAQAEDAISEAWLDAHLPAWSYEAQFILSTVNDPGMT